MEKKKKETIISVITITLLVIMLAIGGMITYLLIIPELEHQGNVDHLKDVIADKDAVSDEYRQGWNDCIQELETWHRRAANATAQIYEMT